MVERDLAKVEVVGSSPIARSIRDLKGKKPIFAGVAQLVERDLAKVEVVGSSPIARSIEKRSQVGAFFVLQEGGVAHQSEV